MCIRDRAYTEDGIHVNSGFLDGMGKEEAIQTMIEWLSEHHCGCAKTTYKLRIVCRYCHDRTGSIACQHIVRDPDRDLRCV